MLNFADVIEGLSVPVLVVERDGSVVFANPEAQKIFSTLNVGDSAQDLSLNEDAIPALLQKSEDAGGGASAKINDASTAQREYKVTAKRLAGRPQEQAERYVLTFEDLTPLRDAKSMRSDFVANVSHEIRSPLTAISGFVESLQDADDIDEETRQMFHGLMGKEVARMTNLVADLLSLSKVEVKERRTLKRMVNIGQVLQQACETVAGLAAERGRSIVRQSGDGLPEVLGKPDDLMRVFINLLENAINYSRPNGTITLMDEVVGSDNPLGRQAICISVRDEGEGIPAGEISRLTERFYRVDKSRSRNLGGTGLGLSIVKHILVRHRGRLTIESTPGVGSTFRVYLPVPVEK